jgi:hypothetical protein
MERPSKLTVRNVAHLVRFSQIIERGYPMKPSMSYSARVGTGSRRTVIEFLFVGALCGALLLFGLGILRHKTPGATPSSGIVGSSSGMAAPIGGRLGGLNSSDTANDAIVRAQVSRVRGLGEGLNQFVDNTSFTAHAERIIGPGEGRNQWVDNSSFAAGSERITGPGEGLNPVSQ